MPGVQDLPHVEAACNAASALLLTAGFAAVRRKRLALHRNLMLGAFAFSLCFLGAYLLFHFGGGTERRFTGAGLARAAYFVLLGSHVLLAAVIVPLVLRVLFLAAKARLPEHRRLARIALPLWLYVDLSGVAVWYILYGSSLIGA